MKIQNIIFLFVFLLFTDECSSQIIDTGSLYKLKNHKSLPYVDNKGNFIDEKPLEAASIKIVFYSFILYKSEKKATIKGRVIQFPSNGDSVGIQNYIFLATPVENKLTKIRTLGPSYDRRLNDSHEDKFPYRNGDFKIEFKFNSNERLYFNGELSEFVEYDIGKLLIKK
jgi:hypothetical protein